ncbi:hypothetical protein ACFVXE_03270 [Streptomyces sp. NPDC058231]|uniref:hypothetical protein n=1 Tax=Streptomyces sp. NPDC058231 TaxID=3346392 RepID=UPI0036EB8133
MDDKLREWLRTATEAHCPDRERMLARVERGMAEGPSARTPRAPQGPLRWLRVVGATAAVCGVLTVGAYAVTSTGAGQTRRGQVAASPVTSASAPAAPGRVHELRTEDGPLRVDGAVDPHSNAYWAQSNVTLRTTQPLSSLTVELRIAQTGGVNTTGSWRSLPEQDFTASAQERSGFLVYRWTLKPGRTVPIGTHMFAGQYNHAEGVRGADGDYITASAARTSGQQVSVGDDFTPDH